MRETRHDSKQAEKEYLARIGASDWELAKPFSHAGADTLVESSRLLHDFAVAMLALRPRPGDLVLDLGAGGCWCSDLLRRLNHRSVAVDISLDMLRTGRRRIGGEAIPAAAGDMERLPFRDGAFNRTVCLNALHHVPDMSRAVAEIARVLAPDGMAFFSEPGQGHAAQATSRSATREFGVLEQDVLIPSFVRACHAAGFRDVRIKPMSYAIPEFDLTPDDWSAWTRLASSKRPIRALAKMGRAVLELFGRGKRGVLFDETQAMRLVRLLRGAVQDHPMILASKLNASREAAPAWHGHIAVDSLPSRSRPGEALDVRVSVTNAGSQVWKASAGGGVHPVTLGVQLLEEQGRLVTRDFVRAPLAADVVPGQTAVLTFRCPSPSMAGRYGLKFDLVAEGVTWFEATGSRPVVIALQVD